MEAEENNHTVKTGARQGIPRQINYLILALTTRCNLRCQYCHHGDSGTGRDMESATLNRAMALAAAGTELLHIQLTGGEPCLVPHLIEEAGRAARLLRRPFTMGIQTNGTLLDPKLAAMFRRLHLQVGISLDGSPRMQETLRGQAAATLRGLMLREAEGIPFRVTTVVSKRNAGQLDRLAWILSAFRQARGIGLDLLVMKGRALTDPSSPRPAKPAELAQGTGMLIRSLTAMNQHRETPLRLREWDLVRRMLDTARYPSSRPFCQAALGASLAVHPDGRCFPCGQTLGDERFRMDPEAASGFPAFSIPILRPSGEECASCPLEGRCPNDCPSRLLYNRPQERHLTCVLYQTLAHACLREREQNGHPASLPGKVFDGRKTCRP